jgi:hypothetical protein
MLVSWLDVQILFPEKDPGPWGQLSCFVRQNAFMRRKVLISEKYIHSFLYNEQQFYGSVSGNEQKESLAGANSRLSIDTVCLCN